MTTESASPAGDPRQLLSGADELARRVRRAQRATWFPLVVLAVVTFAAVPVDRYGHYATTCTAAGSAGPAGRVCVTLAAAAAVYWPVALVAAYAAVAAFYFRRARARGIGTRVWPYVTAGIIIAVLVTGASLWAASHPAAGESDILGLHLQAQSLGLLFRLVNAFGAIGLALLVLAWAERNRALLVFTLGFLAVMLIPPDSLGWAVARSSPWSFLPHLVINGSVLVLGGVAFALAQRSARQPGT
jgi:hypothetical protein